MRLPTRVFCSEIEKGTVEKVAVAAKGEAAKDFKIGIHTGMKTYLRCNKCEKTYFSNPSTSEPVCRGLPGPQEGVNEEGEEICSQRTY